MKGRSARILHLIPLTMIVSLCDREAVNLMAHNARSQSQSASEKSPKKTIAARKKTAAAKSALRRLPPAASQGAEATLRKMTTDEKIGQLLFTTYHGRFTAKDAPAYQQMMHDVKDLHVGGFINVTEGSPLGIVKSQAYPTAVLTNQLQAKSKVPLLVGADFERGAAMRLDEGTSFPTAMALAAAGKPRDADTMGKGTAQEARAVGIQWVYAPGADGNNNPGNSL